MEVKKGQFAYLWDGGSGKVLDTTATKANILRENGKRMWESFDKIIIFGDNRGHTRLLQHDF